MLFSTLRGRYPDLTCQNLDRMNTRYQKDSDLQHLFKLRQEREDLTNRRNQEVERLLKIVLPKAVQEPLVLSDRRKIVIRGVQRAADDGNCGFRSIWGEAYLKENNALFTRKGVIECLKARLSSMAIRVLVAKDIFAKYNEWIAGQWCMEQDRLFPIELKTHFIAFRHRAGQNNDPGYQNNLLREIEEFCRQDNTMLSYLDNYLINDSIWPHVQGSFLAFANILGIRVHCFQKQSNGNYQVLADDGQDSPAEYREEVFILQSETRNHFDRLVVDIQSPNYDPRFLPNPPPPVAKPPAAPALQPAFTERQIGEIEAHVASLPQAKK